MNIFKISYKGLKDKKLSSFLSILLVAFGIAIISSLLLLSDQLSKNLEKNAKDIDAVVGAKGSPLQLILSSIYYIDFPTGNIPLKDAERIARNPLVKMAVPLALGDNFDGNRIVGTDSSFINLYQLTLDKGAFWKNDFEVSIGYAIASSKNLQVGDEIYGSHGLTTGGELHETRPYKIVGIIARQDNVVDNLVLTNISSIWGMHEHHDEEEVADTNSPVLAEEEQGHMHHPHHEETAADDDNRQITSLLIQYRSPMSVIMFPKMVNESTFMQAASPAMESARLFSLIGVGIDTLEWFALLIIIISAISVFVTLYNSLKERRYDLAVMRTLGASKTKLFLIIITEGIILTFIGSLLGLVAGHFFVELIGSYQEEGQITFNGDVFLQQEIYLLMAGLLIGIIASVIPAIQAYKTDIAKTLSR
jgi:putative ABC transport system permease protein